VIQIWFRFNVSLDITGYIVWYMVGRRLPASPPANT